MKGFTLLSKNQVWGRKRLDIFEKRGIKAAATDFSKILGAEIFKETVDGTDFNVRVDNRTGFYWTRTRDANNGSFVYIVEKNASKNKVNGFFHNASIRPAIIIPKGEEIPTNGKKPERAEDGVLEVEYGYYPQRVATAFKQGILEDLYQRNRLSPTFNSYHTMGEEDSLIRNNEYEYEGKRYVRIKPSLAYADIYKERQARVLSNTKIYDCDEYVWVEVQPVKWLVDEKEMIMVSEKLICSGVPFNDRPNSSIVRFEDTFIKKFMDNYLLKEMIQIHMG